MNTHVLIPLIATIAYIPLFAILLIKRPWDKKQRFFFLFLIPAILWSFSDIFFRSDFFMADKLLLIKVVLCIMIWMIIQFHYFLCSFYRPQGIKIPVAYVFPVSTVALALLGYIPRGIEITTSGINVNYGIWIIAIALLFLFTLGAKDIYSLVQRYKISPDPTERNQIAYLLSAIGVLTVFLLSSIAPRGGEYPVAHLGNLINACILTYAIVAHRLLDVRVVLRQGLMYLSLYGSGVALVVGLLSLAHLLFAFNPDVVTLAAVIGIGIPIVFFLNHKARGFLQRKTEQAFTGDKYDSRKQLSGFVAKIYDVPTLEQFGNQFVSLLSQSVDCRTACLLLPEAEGGDFVGRFAYPPAEDNPVVKLKLRHDSPILTWLKREAKTLPERDMSILPEFQGLWQEEKEDIQSAKIELFLPLMHNDKLIAILAAGSKRGGKFYTVEDTDLMDSIASHVAASMEKEYLHERLQEQDQELSIINRLTGIVTSSMAIQDIFKGFTEELKKAVDVDWATIALIEGDKLRISALSSTIGSAWQTGERMPLEGTATERVAKEKTSLYESNLARHRRFWTEEHHLRQGVRSIVYLPLVVRGEGIGSLIVASRRADAYNPKEIRLLERLALQIATPVENSQLYARAEQRSRIDELTGLFNRRHFEERLKEEIARHSRHGNVFSLLMLDLDFFKAYNDMYGHPSGDRLLNQMGEIINSSIRDADQAFRYGGDEFAVILPQTDIKDAYLVAERVRECIAAEMEAKQVAVTCSIGLASYPSDGVMSGELVNTSDTALYYAKNTGGNRTYLSSKIFSEPETEIEANARAGGLSTVYALAAAVDAKDHYTYGHSRKVNTYAVALAEAIGLPPDEASRISTAALLHDIGKIGVPDRILNKKGKINVEEWEAIKSHPRLGANIIGNVPDLAPCVSVILYHHERWDGTGYPEGLKGKAIPLDARILAIADAFAAMTSARPYRDAFCDDKVVEKLRHGAGTQFDPELVEVFIGLIAAGLHRKAKVGHASPSEQPSP
ncbi:MAG: diguanylate cyclase [Dehalococcoidia bacterium]|nr:diguanylate cyclase [Dehalococcoidia bacterium]